MLESTLSILDFIPNTKEYNELFFYKNYCKPYATLPYLPSKL